MSRGIFQVCLVNDTLTVRVQQLVSFTSMSVSMDGNHIDDFAPTPEIRFDLSPISTGIHFFDLGLRYSDKSKSDANERFYIWHHDKTATTTRDFQAGDILVACDNIDGLPPGYMGHSAIVADENQLIEAVMKTPYIRKDTIDQFLKAHPIHAHFRPVLKNLGQKAIDFSNKYLQIYNDNVKEGKQIPPFSFSETIPLEDPWGCIYCSKLVWLSYYYGANYRFYNDYFLFAPEDLETALNHDKNFVLLYKHLDFDFKVDL